MGRFVFYIMLAILFQLTMANAVAFFVRLEIIPVSAASTVNETLTFSGTFVVEVPIDVCFARPRLFR